MPGTTCPTPTQQHGAQAHEAEAQAAEQQAGRAQRHEALAEGQDAHGQGAGGVLHRGRPRQRRVAEELCEWLHAEHELVPEHRARQAQEAEADPEMLGILMVLMPYKPQNGLKRPLSAQALHIEARRGLHITCQQRLARIETSLDIRL